MLYEPVPYSVQNSDLTHDYLPYDSDEWRRMVADAEREDQESL